MTIAILGAGNVGTALASNLHRLGESVVFGVPDPGKYLDVAARWNASVGTVAQAVANADLVILAVPYAAALDIAEAVGDWAGRILVDATNPLAPGLAGLQLGTDRSGAEAIAARAVGARVVKAFNVTGAENLGDPSYAPIALPVAGDDAEARATVCALARRMGFDAIDAGPLAVARYLEPMAMLWIHLAFKAGAGRQWAFVRAARPAT